MELHLNKPLCFFDLETTGVQFVHDRIVEICLHKVMPDGSEQTLTHRINPGRPIPAEVSQIHGIYDIDVAHCPSFKELSGELSAFIANSDLAGYNSNRFDVPFLVEEFLRAGVNFEMKSRRLLDVQNIFHRMEQRTLSAAYKFYCGKPLEGAHGAKADTLATYEILKAQLDKYENTPFEDKDGNVSIPIVNEVQALSDFTCQQRFVDFAGVMTYDAREREIFNIGKHKGREVVEVFRTEPSYYDWMMKADFALSTKQCLTAIYLRLRDI